MGEPVAITKIMSVTPAEFASGIERLMRDMPGATDEKAARFVLNGGGEATIIYERREARRLSSLFVVPQAAVTLTFTNVPDEDRTAFIAAFDQVFQRGGG